MKFTLSWLKDHLETDASVDAIAEAAAILLQGDDAAFTTKVALILKPAKKSEAKRAKDTDHEDQK